ncbi:2-hydroxychromene-2-carboxylate isomerase [Parerythrobacter jejuensis]|uniref:2-hydroxychromene-2-carboxylate isomerase n=1 Tax=Parerythrobacter jejuensis TaxID=795812 RepID=A0A845ATS4_9SPHN|nr:2-hydroxychromene-2-carboxylate isomerase [Parerythrobacter jejuensis]MXP32767.1 2-hydroxychromene-2-carboxylate isomerase [Parerythrobacter jejuensis]
MTKTVEFIFDFVSPNGYLVWQPLRDMVARTGAQLEITPAFLGGMHKLTGNAPPMIRDKDVKGKVEYAMLEMQRWIAKHGFDKFQMHPQFPFNSVNLLRMLLAVEGEERIRLADALLPALWEEGVAVDDPAALGAALSAAGFDGQELFAKTQDPAIKQQLMDNTQNAVDRGTFGIPTFFIGNEMFFGKERLGQMEEMLTEG